MWNCLNCSADISHMRADAKYCSDPCANRVDYRNNQERIREQVRLWAAAHKEHVRVRDREYRERNRQKIYVRQRSWVAANRERHVEYQRQYARTWAARNKHRLAVYAHNRHKRIRYNRDSVRVAPADWLRTLNRFDYRCAYCGIKTDALHMDHVIPLARGGRHAIGNLVPACAPCNSSKGARFVMEWRIHRMTLEVTGTMSDFSVEGVARPSRRLGRLPNDPSKPRLKLGPHLGASVPPNPAVVDWLSKVDTWPMYLNDKIGDCTCAMLGHAVEAYTTYGHGVTAKVTDQDVLTTYEKASGYNPSDPSTDQGAVIQDVLDCWRKVGIGGHKILAFAQVDHTNPDEVKSALNVFGAVLVGINFPAVAMDQFDAGKPWDVAHNDGGIEGGHAIHVGHADTSGVRYQLTTWGAVQGMTQAFWDKYVEECWVAVSPEWLDAAGHSPEGLDLYGLGEAFSAITGQANPFPVQPSPQPVPGPAPVPAPPAVDPVDEALVEDLRGWLTEHHTGDNRRAVASVVKWMAAKGLTLAS